MSLQMLAGIVLTLAHALVACCVIRSLLAQHPAASRERRRGSG